MANHDTSIGTDNNAPVDGIQGTNPGTQQPSGAHVDAGEHATHGGSQGHNNQHEPRRPSTGTNQDGVIQPTGVTGVMGRRTLQPGELEQLVRGKVNGSLSLAGKTVGVRIGCGAMSLQRTLNS